MADPKDPRKETKDIRPSQQGWQEDPTAPKATVAVEGQRLDRPEDSKSEEEKERERILAKMQTGSPLIVTEEEQDKILEKVVKEEKKNDDGTTTVVKSLSEAERNRASSLISSIPQVQNETANLTGVPGEEDLTRGGTLAGDRSKKMKDLDKLTKEIEKTAGPNPLPNREGNEITKAMNGFRPESAIHVNSLVAEVDNLIASGALKKEDQEKLSKARARL